MSTLLSNVGKKIDDLKQELGSNVRLAGLGVYSKSVEEINGLSDKSRSLVGELMERGREVERSAKERVSSTASQTSSALEERLRDLVAKVTGVDAKSLADLDEKLKKLNEQVNALVANQKTDQPAAKKPVAPKAKAAPAKAKPKAVRRRVPAKSAE